MDQGINWDVTRAINGLAGQVGTLDLLMWLAATDLIFVILLAPLLWWFLPLAASSGKRAALAAIGAVVASQGLNLVIGHLLFVPRPFVAHHVLLLVQAAHDSSFPSDHATAAFAVAMTGVRRRLPGGQLLLVLATLVAGARVYVGAHYPADVLAGAFLGSAWTSLFLAGENRLAPIYQKTIALAERLRLA